jgi:hypothetical protein
MLAVPLQTSGCIVQIHPSLYQMIQLWLMWGVCSIVAAFLELPDSNGTFSSFQGVGTNDIQAFGSNCYCSKSVGYEGDLP